MTDSLGRENTGRKGHPESVYLEACEHISNGALVEDAAKLAGCTGTALRDWAARTPENAAAYARARLVSTSHLEEEILERARSVTPETYTADNVAINALKWIMGKRHPKEYGDRVQHDTTVTIGTLHLDALRQRTVVTAAISQAEEPHLLSTPTPDPSGGDIVPEAD